MAETLTLSKILYVRENEKKIAQKDFHQSMNDFEKVATDFYTLLKKKENAEASYEQFLQSSVPINQLKQLTSYIEILNNKIVELQEKVNSARHVMEMKQSKLSEAHIEVKKFEKLIENRINWEKDHQSRMEKAFMDEISINQFSSHETR